MKNKIRAILYEPRAEDHTMVAFLGKYATHGGDIVYSSQKAADAVKMASDTTDGIRGSVFDAAVYLGVPEDNPLFDYTGSADWARIETTKYAEEIIMDAPNLVADGYVLTAICICPDGFVLFWRTFIENN